MQEFIVNEFISLKLESGSTNIYVNGQHQHFCKHLLISIPFDETQEWDHYESMDEIIKATRKRAKFHGGPGGSQATGLTPEEAFRGHCSNIQAWVDHGYDYRLLDTTLSIPIMVEIMTDIIKRHNERRATVEPKDFYKQKFRRFFLSAVESIDAYMENSRLTYQDRYTGRIRDNPAVYNKFGFLYNILFRKKDTFFSDEEINGSFALKKIYLYFLPRKQKEDRMRNLNYYERKLWKPEPVEKRDGGYYVGDKYFNFEFKAKKYANKKNLEYRRFLRTIRDSVDPDDRNKLAVSDKVDYLPYLYAKGKFIKDKNIAFIEINDTIYIRDQNGYYWKEVGDEWRGY